MAAKAATQANIHGDGEADVGRCCNGVATPAMPKAMTRYMFIAVHTTARFAALALLLSACNPATACISGGRQGLMPLCEPQVLDPAQRTIAITGNGSVPTNLRFVHADRGPISAKLVDIDIESTDRPLHIVLSHGHPAILRFTGKTEAVARVTALGASFGGPDFVGIIGVDPSRIVRVPVTGEDPLRMTTCGAPPNACALESLFHVPKFERRPFYSNWPPYGDRPRIDEAVWIGTTSRVLISQDSVTSPTPGGSIDKAAWPRHPETLSAVEAYLQNHGPAIILDPTTVHAPIPLETAPTLPSWEGLAAFERRGLLHFPGSAAFDRIYEGWTERFSARYRRRLGSQFTIRPAIDALVTGPIRIPLDLLPHGSKPSVVLLIARDAPIPEMEQRHGACFFFDDKRTHQHACNRLSAPDLATRNLLAEDERLEHVRRRRN